MKNDNKKSTNINDLAVKMDAGFIKVNENFIKVNENFIKVNENHEFLARMVAKGFEKVDSRLEKVDSRLEVMDHTIKALNSNVNNYLELSERRYVELKQRDVLLAKWLKLVADKTGVPIDVSQLEKV